MTQTAVPDGDNEDIASLATCPLGGCLPSDVSARFGTRSSLRRPRRMFWHHHQFLGPATTFSLYSWPIGKRGPISRLISLLLVLSHLTPVNLYCKSLTSLIPGLTVILTCLSLMTFIIKQHSRSATYQVATWLCTQCENLPAGLMSKSGCWNNEVMNWQPSRPWPGLTSSVGGSR